MLIGVLIGKRVQHMTTCKRCAIQEAWMSVRNARTYQTVVDRAHEWLPLFWEEARLMKLAQKSLRKFPCPVVYISASLGSSTAGKWNGTSIQLQELHHQEKEYHFIKVYRDRAPYSLRDDLRKTILHEVQHAIDHFTLSLPVTDDEAINHDAAFHHRLNRLIRTFPVEGA